MKSEKNIMEEKKYPVVEEEDGYGCMMAAEPAVACAVQVPNSTGICLDEEAETTDRLPLGAFGFYTDNPDVFEQRVAEIEADMDEVDAGIEDPEKWIQVDDFWDAMKKEHPWL